MEKKKTYKNVNKLLLKAIPNPATKPYEIKIKQPELTFLGVHNQPDFGTLFILMYPKKKIIELKSLKIYLQQFRNIIISYERILNVVFDHINEVYDPDRLRIVLDCNPRGGISSMLSIDSDWSVLGGEDKYKDWSETTW